MKKFLFLILLLAGNTVFAQDYAPLPDTGIRRYFTNSAGYLRGIRVDSVVQENGYKQYVTFRTARGWKPGAGNSSLADSNGACWLGKNVRVYANGDWHFPNRTGDTILVKANAGLGDSWVFHRDTSAIWTEARVLSIDTQTVFGVLDSVKIIQLTLKNGSVTLPANPISAFQIVLSKTMGFAKVPDLYLFPYKDLDSAYNKQDYWYRKLRQNSNGIVDKATLLFSQVSGWNLPQREMYDFQVGDVIYGRNYSNSLPTRGTYIDTVAARQDFPDSTRYTCNSWTWKTYTNQNGNTLLVQHGSYTFSKTSQPSFDTLLMPEEYSGGCNSNLYVHFADSSFCNRKLLIEQAIGYGCGLRTEVIAFREDYKFKRGLGQVYYRYADGDGVLGEDDLYSYQKNGILCSAIPQVPSKVQNVSLKSTDLKLYPQPATNQVFLEAPQLRYPATIRIQNLQGQLLSTQELSAAGKSVSTANLRAGLYLLSVTDASGNSAVQKLLIEAN